jgi:hypothetical protein
VRDPLGEEEREWEGEGVEEGLRLPPPPPPRAEAVPGAVPWGAEKVAGEGVGGGVGGVLGEPPPPEEGVGAAVGL